MDTKNRILDEALKLFSEKGYGNVYVEQIARAVGIKAPSLYKHFKSKQDIFDAILRQVKENYDRKAASFSVRGNNAEKDLEVYTAVSEDELVKMGEGLFLHFLHDEYACRVRKMLTLQQFGDGELAQIYTRQYHDDPLQYQSLLFAGLAAAGIIRHGDPYITAMHFYAPIYMLLTLCDRHPDREEEALDLLERHIRQFSTVYHREDQR